MARTFSEKRVFGVDGKMVKLWCFYNKIYSLSRNTVIFLRQWEKGIIILVLQT